MALISTVDFLQVSRFEWLVRVLPSGLKFSSNFFHARVFLLSFQSPQKAKQRPGISGVLFEIGTKHRFRPTAWPFNNNALPRDSRTG
jgi:hypothetical protein